MRLTDKGFGISDKSNTTFHKSDGTGVQIFVSATKVKNMDMMTDSDPQCSLKSRPMFDEDTPWKFLGDTEVIDNNLNPQWLRHFSINYVFHLDKELKFEVWNYNTANDKDLIGEVLISLNQLMGCKGMTMIEPLILPYNKKKGEKRGMLKIWADTIVKT